MALGQLVGCFFGGVFLANFVPHYVTGMTGRPFHSPFAKPPFRGLSPPAVNIAWGLFNLLVACVLLLAVGHLELHDLPRVGAAAVGFGLMSFNMARSLKRMQDDAHAEPRT